MIHKYCRATTKKTGAQCRNLPAKGSTVCRYHGGQAKPQEQAR